MRGVEVIPAFSQLLATGATAGAVVMGLMVLAVVLPQIVASLVD